MKVQVLVLIQQMTNCVDFFPVVNFVEVDGDKLNDGVVLECLQKGMNGTDVEEDPIDFLKYHSDNQMMSRSDNCVCIWGEELEIIFTVVG